MSQVQAHLGDEETSTRQISEEDVRGHDGTPALGPMAGAKSLVRSTIKRTQRRQKRFARFLNSLELLMAAGQTISVAVEFNLPFAFYILTTTLNYLP